MGVGLRRVVVRRLGVFKILISGGIFVIFSRGLMVLKVLSGIIVLIGNMGKVGGFMHTGIFIRKIGVVDKGRVFVGWGRG